MRLLRPEVASSSTDSAAETGVAYSGAADVEENGEEVSLT